MSTQAVNLLLRTNLLQQQNDVQQINLLLRPTQVIPPGPPGPPGNAYGFETETGRQPNLIVLEDGVSILLLENQS